MFISHIPLATKKLLQWNCYHCLEFILNRGITNLEARLLDRNQAGSLNREHCGERLSAINYF